MGCNCCEQCSHDLDMDAFLAGERLMPLVFKPCASCHKRVHLVDEGGEDYKYLEQDLRRIASATLPSETKED